MTASTQPPAQGPEMHLLTAHVGQEIDMSDAGMEAARRMRNKRTAMQKAKFMFNLIVWSIILIALLTIAGIGYYGYKTRVFHYVTSERKCSVQLAGSEEKLLGARTYGQRQFTYFGMWHVIDSSEVSEQTRVDVRGYSLTVVGTDTLAEGKELRKGQTAIGGGRYYWTKNAGQGEQGTLILDPATTYTFLVDKKGVAVVDYDTFCR